MAQRNLVKRDKSWSAPHISYALRSTYDVLPYMYMIVPNSTDKANVMSPRSHALLPHSLHDAIIGFGQIYSAGEAEWCVVIVENSKKLSYFFQNFSELKMVTFLRSSRKGHQMKGERVEKRSGGG
jgi:hypothetical protein